MFWKKKTKIYLYSKQKKNMDDKPNSTIYKRHDSQVILCDQCSKGQ